jgi:MFS family permease
MLVCALAVVPMIFASGAKNMWVAVALIGIAAAAHQGWSANMFTFASDTFPKQAVGSVVGLGGMAGAVGGMLIAKLTAYLLEMTQSYASVFLLAGTAPVALVIIRAVAASRARMMGRVRVPGPRAVIAPSAVSLLIPTRRARAPPRPLPPHARSAVARSSATPNCSAGPCRRSRRRRPGLDACASSISRRISARSSS